MGWCHIAFSYILLDIEGMLWLGLEHQTNQTANLDLEGFIKYQHIANKIKVCSPFLA